MKTSIINLALIGIGIVCVAIGTFRTFPLQIADRRFWWQNGPLIVACVIIIGLAMGAGGVKFLRQGVDGTVAVTASFLILLVLLMPIIGFSGPVAKHYEHSLSALLGSQGGYIWAFVCSVLSPSGSAFSGVVSSLWPDRPELRPLLLYFLTVVPLTSFTIYYIRALGLGNEIATEMYKVNMFVALALMPGFWVYGKFFYR